MLASVVVGAGAIGSHAGAQPLPSANCRFTVHFALEQRTVGDEQRLAILRVGSVAKASGNKILIIVSPEWHTNNRLESPRRVSLRKIMYTLEDDGIKVDEEGGNDESLDISDIVIDGCGGPRK